jgi:transposase-like protein
VTAKQVERRELWRQKIAQQEKSGQTVSAFCREHGLREPSFYGWRQRLGSKKAVAFALVETKPATEVWQPVELILTSGDRLRIPNDAATLRLVLGVLREPA